MPFRRILLALCCVAPALAAQGRKGTSPLGGFDEYVGAAVRAWRVPGLAIAVVKDDSVAFIKGYGVRELGKPEPVTEHTRFGVMSTTKAFTAMLLAMLVDSGKVAFDDPVTKHVPGLELKDPYVTRELTLRDLLTHRLGFGDPGYLWDNSGLDMAGVIERLRLVPVETSFRSRFAYNNVGFGLAGLVAGRAGGTTWQALLRDRIYRPLGMSESFPDAREMLAAGTTDVTAPHGLVDDTVRILPASPTIVDPVAPAGAMFSSAADMAKWIRFLLDSARVGGRRLVGAARFAELFRPQAIVPDDEFYPTARLTHPRFQAYGMGWFLEDYRGEFVAFHTGSIEGRSAIVGLIPDRRLGVVVLTNLDHSELRHALMYTVFDRYLGGSTHDWSAEMRTLYTALRDTATMRRTEREAKRIAGTHPTLPLDQYAGRYSDPLYGTVTVERAGDGFTVTIGDQRGDAVHWQYDLFRVNWRDRFQGSDYVTFQLDPDGSVGELRVAGSPFRYRRVRNGGS